MPSKVLSVSLVNLIVDGAGSDNGFSVILACIWPFLGWYSIRCLESDWICVDGFWISEIDEFLVVN